MADAPLGTPTYQAPSGEAYFNETGATIRPQYVERRPPMWAVGETDLDALSLTGNIVNASFAIGSFFLGFAANIWITYAGAEKLTEVGGFLLYRGTVCALIVSAFFFVAGYILNDKKKSLWNKIKSESRQISPPSQP
jgi:hypothetical protein